MRKFRPLFGPKGLDVKLPRFVDGPAVGFWDFSRPPTDILADIPAVRTVVHPDGTVPGSGERRRYLWQVRVMEELAAFNGWVRILEIKRQRVPFRNLRPDRDNPRVFYCDYYPPGSNRPITFKIKLPPNYPEEPPRTEGLGKHVAYGRYKIGGEPCLGEMGKKNWRRNWRRWGIAHYLALISGGYESTKEDYTIKVEE